MLVHMEFTNEPVKFTIRVSVVAYIGWPVHLTLLLCILNLRSQLVSLTILLSEVSSKL